MLTRTGNHIGSQNLGYPAGNLYKGQHFDHLSMDVVELFRLDAQQTNLKNHGPDR
jgi:hypothetical protein